MKIDIKEWVKVTWQMLGLLAMVFLIGMVFGFGFKSTAGNMHIISYHNSETINEMINEN